MDDTWRSPLHGRYGVDGSEGMKDGCVTAVEFEPIAAAYGSIRQGIGLTDYSHYGKFELSGPAALDLVNRANLADISRLAINKMTSSLMLKEDGSVLCDAYVVNQGTSYLLLTEGVHHATVAALLGSEADGVGGPVTVVDQTRELALIGLDGPFAWELLKDLVGVKVLGMRYLEVVTGQVIDQVPFTLLRAGKTGEFGYLLLVDAGQVGRLWERLLDAGRDYQARPCGFEVIDLCKIENRFLNMHREGALAANALELNCRVMVGREKDDYLGREAVEEVLRTGPRRRLIGLAVNGETNGPEDHAPVCGSEILYQGECIGILANTSYSFGLSQQIGLGLLDTRYAYVGLDYELQSQGTTWPIRTLSAPFLLNRSLSVRPQEDSYHTAKG
jgi:aminomethyltransferase